MYAMSQPHAALKRCRRNHGEDAIQVLSKLSHLVGLFTYRQILQQRRWRINGGGGFGISEGKRWQKRWGGPRNPNRAEFKLEFSLAADHLAALYRKAQPKHQVQGPAHGHRARLHDRKRDPGGGTDFARDDVTWAKTWGFERRTLNLLN